jgi:hypothetical protein
MISVDRSWRRTAVALIFVAAAAAPALTQQPARTPVLGRLEPGLWQLRSLGGGLGQAAPVCIGDPAILAQLQHRRSNCSRSLVSSNGDTVALRYSCDSAGMGHSTIRVETPRLARIESQGVDGGIPFEFRAEARRIGPCR